MFYKKYTRTSNPARRKTKSRSRRSTRTSIVQALIIESMAVVAILVLFLGVRADLNNQSRMKNRWDGAKEYPQEVTRKERRVGLLAQPNPSTAQEVWCDWSCN